VDFRNISNLKNSIKSSVPKITSDVKMGTAKAENQPIRMTTVVGRQNKQLIMVGDSETATANRLALLNDTGHTLDLEAVDNGELANATATYDPSSIPDRQALVKAMKSGYTSLYRTKDVKGNGASSDLFSARQVVSYTGAGTNPDYATHRWNASDETIAGKYKTGYGIGPKYDKNTIFTKNNIFIGPTKDILTKYSDRLKALWHEITPVIMSAESARDHDVNNTGTGENSIGAFYDTWGFYGKKGYTGLEKMVEEYQKDPIISKTKWSWAECTDLSSCTDKEISDSVWGLYREMEKTGKMDEEDSEFGSAKPKRAITLIQYMRDRPTTQLSQQYNAMRIWAPWARKDGKASMKGRTSGYKEHALAWIKAESEPPLNHDNLTKSYKSIAISWIDNTEAYLRPAYKASNINSIDSGELTKVKNDDS
jgi:hypothetical protein